MVSEKIDKKVEWLESERRETLDRIADLERRLADAEEDAASCQKTIKNLEDQLKEKAGKAPATDDFEQEIKSLKGTLKDEIDKLEEKQRQGDKQLESRLLAEQQGTMKAIDEFRGRVNEIDAFRSSIKNLQNENENLSKSMAALNEAMDEISRAEERRQKTIKSLEETGAKDAKRLASMEGDLSAALQHIEKVVARNETNTEQQRKLLGRLDGVVEAEKKRREDQKEFMEQANATRVANERKFQEWEKRFEGVLDTSKEVNDRIKDVEAAEMTLKRAQKSFDDLVEKINRRVDELTEIQRLGEQRFRQEWSTFQADSQKRWSSFTLDQEEIHKESNRQREKLAKQTAELEETLQEVQDLLQHLSDHNERYMQSMLESLRDALAENENFMNSLG